MFIFQPTINFLYFHNRQNAMDTTDNLNLATYPSSNGLGDRPEDSQAQNFNFMENVPPSNVDKFINIFSIVKNIQDNLSFASSMIVNGVDCRHKPMTLGNRYFISSGTCDAETSEPICQGQTRYLYIDNVPSPYPACANPNLPMDQTCSQYKTTGLVPGILQDMAQVNPMELIASFAGEGSIVNNKCVLRKELVGFENANGKQYHTETRCSAPKRPLICNIDFFEDYYQEEKEKMSNLSVSMSDIVLLGSISLIILGVVGYVVFKKR